MKKKQIVDKSKKIVKKIIKGRKKYNDYSLQEIMPFKVVKSNNDKIRLNILTTSINNEDIYAGIKTAVDFFYNFGNLYDMDMRVISMDKPINRSDIYKLSGFTIEDSLVEKKKSIIDMSSRDQKLPVSKKDVFITTMWHTAYSIIDLLEWYKKQYQIKPFFIYLIQDYEPGFYSWSSRYVLAESTYHIDANVIAVFNSCTLKDYFKSNNYSFYSDYYFTPKLNENLKTYLINNKNKYTRKKQILIYGRPSKARNAFEIIVAALNEWFSNNPDAKEWTVLSVGEQFDDFTCPSGLQIASLGKLSIQEYAKVMLESRIGISLMISPHPSYPPLEMSTFGIKVITNTYANKDLSKFNSNIISLSNVSTHIIAQELKKLTKSELSYEINLNSNYLNNNEEQWNNIYKGIMSDIEKLIFCKREKSNEIDN